jgi:hypothetical protein
MAKRTFAISGTTIAVSHGSRYLDSNLADFCPVDSRHLPYCLRRIGPDK